MNSSNNYEGEKMVKAELIENPQENELIINDNVPDVDVAIEQWDAYQKLCKGLLNDTDYQEIIVKEKDENGNYVKVKRHFKKKSAWQKLSRAFNVEIWKEPKWEESEKLTTVYVQVFLMDAA